jgi:uracil-DNA glycosylase family 4
MLCTDCRLHKDSKINCMKGDGPSRADMLFLGEAPGEEEERTGKPFVGRAGQFQDRHIFRGAGITRAHVRITNAVRCRPKNNKTPGPNEIAACRRHLDAEVAKVKPKVIVLLGNVPLYSVVPMPKKDNAEKKYQGKVTGITKWRGNLMWHDKYQCWVMPTFHPSGLSRDFNMGSRYRLEQTIADVEEAERAVGRAKPVYKYPETELVDDPRRAIAVLTQMCKSKVIGLDLETEDFDPWSCDIIGASMSNDGIKGYFILWDVILKSEFATKLFKRLCAEDKPLKVFHNAGFDVRFLRVKGIQVSRLYRDTMIMAHLHDENFYKGLKPLTWRHLTFGGYELPLEEYMRAQKRRSYKGVPSEIMAPYAGLDACATFQLFHKFEPLLREESTLPLFSHILMPTRDVMTSAEIHGFKTDPEYAKSLNSKCDVAREALLKDIYKAAGGEFNLKSPKQMSAVLYKKMKLPVVAKSKTGNPSCSKKALEILSKHKRGAIVKDILSARYVVDQQTKFIKLAFAGVVHQRYNLAGTGTGRSSCSDPGLHNIPKDRIVRAIFRASLGNVLVCADGKSMELRMLAACCGEPALLKAFEEGRDLHNWVFNLMFHKPSDYIPTQEERFIAKAINFGLIYGRGPRSLAETLKCSEEQARRYIDLYFRTFPRAKQFLIDNVKEARALGYAVTFFGRRRRLPELRHDMNEPKRKAERQANNMVMQSPAADATYMALTRIARALRARGLKAVIIHTVHDCVIVDTPKAEVAIVKKIILGAFSKPIKVLPVKIEAGVEVEERWGLHNDSRLYGILEKYVDVSDLPKKLTEKKAA